MTGSSRFQGAPGLRVLAVVAAGILGGALPARALEPGELDPTPFQVLLQKYVHDGRVDYPAWKAAKPDVEALGAYLASVADYDLTSTFGKEARASLLINVYNAWAIRQILDHYPVKSVQEIPGFLDANRIPVAGEDRSLNEIEEALARIFPTQPTFAYFLVPGTSGWPRLRDVALSSEVYDEQVRITRRAMVTEGHLHYDKEANQVHLPAVVMRYIEAYDDLPKGLPGFLAEDVPLAVLIALQNSGPERVPVEIDWALNDASVPVPTTPGSEKP